MAACGAAGEHRRTFTHHQQRRNEMHGVQAQHNETVLGREAALETPKVIRRGSDFQHNETVLDRDAAPDRPDVVRRGNDFQHNETVLAP
jgi:hypothetical protein